MKPRTRTPNEITIEDPEHEVTEPDENVLVRNVTGGSHVTYELSHSQNLHEAHIYAADGYTTPLTDATDGEDSRSLFDEEPIHSSTPSAGLSFARLGKYRRDALAKAADAIRSSCLSDRSALAELKIEHKFETVVADIRHGVFDVTAKISFSYKDHDVTGTGIHIAAMHECGAKVIRRMVAMQADVSEQCQYKGFGGKLATLEPVHLASGCGHVATLRALLRAKADVNAAAMYNDKFHYNPIHDAAYLGQVETAEFLLKKRVQVDSANRDGYTALHFAARQGFPKVAQLLLRNGASVTVKSHGSHGKTPLQCAFESDKVTEYLYLFASQSFGDILQVADFCPQSAAQLAKQWCRLAHKKSANVSRQRPAGSPHSTSSADPGIVQGITGALWMHLAAIAPEAAEDLLDAVTITPETQAPRHYPLPKRACIPGVINCMYVPDTLWKYDHTKDKGHNHPKWHERLAPKAQIRARDCALVELKRVDLPGILCLEVFFVLVQTKRSRMFSKLATQAILDFAWTDLVQYYYYLMLVYRCTLLAVLVWWAVNPPTSILLQRICWSLGCATSLLCFSHELSELVGYTYILKKPAAYFLEFSNIVDISGHTFGLLLWSLTASLEPHRQPLNFPELFVFTSIYRWLNLMSGLRAFPRFGRKILPIIHSFEQMIPMVLLTTLLFLAFYHACVVIETSIAGIQANEFDPDQRMLVTAFRLMFTGDGDGIDGLLTLGGRGEHGDWLTQALLGAAVWGFCVCVLNLYIAVHSEAYDMEQERAAAYFLMERADICLQCLLQPHWTRCFIRRPWCVIAVLWLFAAGTWLLLLHVPGLHVLASFYLFGALMLGNAILLQRSWKDPMLKESDEDDATQNCLWICHTCDWQKDYWPEDAERERDVGRMACIKIEQSRQTEMLRMAQESARHGLHTQFEEVRERLDKIEESLCSLVDRAGSSEAVRGRRPSTVRPSTRIPSLHPQAHPGAVPLSPVTQSRFLEI